MAQRSWPVRGAAWTLAMAATALLGSACRDLVTDDVVDAAEALCARLQACGLSGCPEVRGFLGDAEDDAARVDDFLRVFAEEECDSGCGSAPICLDFAPVCARLGSGCQEDAGYLCCDASRGTAACRADAGGEARCCRPPSVVCTDADECCPLEDGAVVGCEFPPGDRVQKTCGGLPPCTPFGESCDTDVDCCSRTCVEGRCDRIECVPSGAGCTAGDVCCSAAEVCERGTCRKPDVCPDGGCGCDEDEQACDPTKPEQCCSGQCIQTISGLSFCGSATCLPIEADCGDDAQCTCEGTRPDRACLELATDQLGGQKTCVVLSCEPDLFGACDDTKPCCAGLSCSEVDPLVPLSGHCEQACEDTQCIGRSPQTFGVAIPRAEDRGENPGVPQAEWDACVAASDCATRVCKDDPFCCCFRWDQFCVEAAVELAASFPECGP
jgi:hypothetical protein